MREIAMVEKSRVVEGICAILAKINEEMNLGLTVSKEMPLIGGDSGIYSVGFLNMISLVQEWLEEEYQVFSSVIAPDENFDPNGTFGSVGRFADYLVQLIEMEQEDAG